MRVYWIAFVSLLLISMDISGQNFTQSLKGRVIDKDTRQPLPGAYISLINGSVLGKTISTDMDGRYELKLDIGRYNVKFSFIGYIPRVINNVEIVSGRQTVLDIELEQSTVMVDVAEIQATRDGEPLNEMALISARQFNVSETERYAGSRGEPSRMASNFAGVQGADDSRNDIVVRGNSPQSILWMLEGIPISNPNHFNIPGTAGGSVSVLNNKTLGNSDFYTGAFPAEFGNSTSAAFDLNLRNGNNDKHEMLGQFGFLGTELLAEGPINREKNYTYLTAYRYSTLSLIGGLGIEYGTSAIPNYQDASFHINLPGKGTSSFSIFGIMGLSDIDILISNEESPDERNIYGSNDRDQYFGSQMFVVGGSYTKSLSENTYLKFTLAYNYSNVDSYHEMVFRHLDAENNYVLDSLKPLLNYQFTESKIVAHTSLNSKLNRKFLVKSGIIAQQFDFTFADSIWNFDINSENYNSWTTRWNSQASAVLLQYYTQTKWKLTDNTNFIFGLHGQYFGLNGSISPIEPRIAARVKASEKSTFSFGAGMHSQVQPHYLYFYSSKTNSDGSLSLYNRSMDFTKAIHLVGGYERMLGQNFRLKSEIYFQQLSQIPIEKNSYSFSLANSGSGFSRFFPDTMINEGFQQNMGIEFTLEKFFSKSYYFLFTGSFFDSQYKGRDGKWRNTDFNGRYALNALVAKEFKSGKKSMFTVGAKVTAVGGRWYGPADIEASNAQRELVVNDSLRNTLQFPDYFRADLKLTYRLNTKKSTHEIGIDLVNLLDTRNVLSLTYAPDESNDPDQSIRREYQLGRLPLFYYRISFGLRNE